MATLTEGCCVDVDYLTNSHVVWNSGCSLKSASVAVCSAIFIRTNAISNLLWKFQRYILVIEYEARPILPPPLVILCHIYLLGKYIRRKCQGKRKFLDNGLSEWMHRDLCRWWSVPNVGYQLSWPPFFCSKFLPNSAGQFVKFRKIPQRYYPQIPYIRQSVRRCCINRITFQSIRNLLTRKHITLGHEWWIYCHNFKKDYCY